jgi:hypothetical protein
LYEFLCNFIEVLTKDEAKSVTNTKEFANFFENSSRLMERALGQDFDLLGDFFEDNEDKKQSKLANLIKIP